MAHTCRGTINLATVHIGMEDSCGILLTSGARNYHLKGSSEVDRQQWITALELAKAKAVRMMDTHSGREHLITVDVYTWYHGSGGVGINSTCIALVTKMPRLGCTNSEGRTRWMCGLFT